MDFEVILQIIVAVFAVFGFCSLIKLTLEAFTFPKNFALAILCDEGTVLDPEEIACDINRARAAWHTPLPCRTVVLLRGGAELPPDVIEALSEKGIEIYSVNNNSDSVGWLSDSINPTDSEENSVGSPESEK